MKKWFVLRLSYWDAIEWLSTAQKWTLFEWIYTYQLTGVKPSFDDQVVNMAFLFFKQQLDADNEKWEQVREKRSEAWKLGGRPAKKQKKQKLSEKANESKWKQKKQHTVTVTVPVTVTSPITETNTGTTPNDVVYFEDKELNNLFVEFIDMRKNMKKEMTDRAKELAIKTLNGLSSDNSSKKKIIERSIMNSWQSFYPLQENPQVKSQKVYDNTKPPEKSAYQKFLDDTKYA